MKESGRRTEKKKASQLEDNLHMTRTEMSLSKRLVNQSRVENSHRDNILVRARMRSTLSKRLNEKVEKRSLPVGLGSTGQSRRRGRRHRPSIS